MNILLGLLIVLLVLVALMLILLILMQRPRQEGLGASFGGHITESVFGAQASNVLEKGTVWLTILFFILTITIAAIYSHKHGETSLQQKLRMPLPSSAQTEVKANENVSSEQSEPASSVEGKPSDNSNQQNPNLTTTPAAPKSADQKSD
ncbi:MAG: preprotein translocase subunit SecG [Methylacidiphilales bacterium]|nr:preprotein translocase subunit SecG [Candidatus Methylacidiphilales bacterium]